RSSEPWSTAPMWGWLASTSSSSPRALVLAVLFGAASACDGAAPVDSGMVGAGAGDAAPRDAAPPAAAPADDAGPPSPATPPAAPPRPAAPSADAPADDAGPPATATHLAAGNHHACAIVEGEPRVRRWGLNAQGQLGLAPADSDDACPRGDGTTSPCQATPRA